MKRVLSLLVLTYFLPGFASPAGAAVMLGQVETFSDPHGWIVGVGPGPGTPQPVPVELGGPGGPSDPYLSIVATGGQGPGSRLSAQEFGMWAGDYTAAGVTSIRMDVNNFGPSDVFLRLLLLEFGPMGPVGGAFTTDGSLVLAGSGWQTISFDVSAAGLTALPLGTGSIADTLANVGELRIFHNPAPFFIPTQMPAVLATVGVDNITAAQLPVPEPAATTLLLLAGVLSVGLVRKRAR
jgi:hypothetical protein